MDEPRYGWAEIGERIPVRWTIRKPHRRKFMKRHGRYLDGDNLTEDDLYFWGEYEAHSDCVFVNKENAPKAVHDVLHPVRGSVPVLSNALNTDPYVFGNHFKNICCGIPKGGDEEKEVYKHGDVIIFGNRKKGLFFFDTVFVVDRRIRIDYYLNKTQYYKLSIEPANLDRENEVKYYYQGVSYINNREFYSFVPCSLEYTNNKLPNVDPKVFGPHRERTKDNWQKILDAVEAAGWEIGVHIDKI